jgi:hypothetical protein
MANLTTWGPAGAPTRATRSLTDLVRRLTSHAEEIPSGYRKLAISDRYAPTLHERAALEQRLGELDAALAPGNLEDVEYEVSAFRLQFGLVRQGDELESRAAVTLTARHLINAKFPTWVVAETFRRILNAEAETIPVSGFAPTLPMLVNECKAVLQKVHEEREPIRLLLQAEIYPEPTEDQKARARAALHWQEMRPAFVEEKTKGQPARTPEQIEAETKKAIAAANEFKANPPTISAQLRKLIDAQDAARAAEREGAK